MAQLLKIKAQLSSIWAKGCILMTVCVFLMTTPPWCLGRKSWYIIILLVIPLAYSSPPQFRPIGSGLRASCPHSSLYLIGRSWPQVCLRSGLFLSYKCWHCFIKRFGALLPAGVANWLREITLYTVSF